jgi:hypothetical protein
MSEFNDEDLFTHDEKVWWLHACAQDWSIFSYDEPMPNNYRLKDWRKKKELLAGPPCAERVVLQFVLYRTERALNERNPNP